MAEKEKKSPEEIIEETLASGGFHALFYLDLHAETAGRIQHLLTVTIREITREPGVVFAFGEIEPPLESEGKYFSSAEVHVLTENFRVLAYLAHKYAPFGIEILRPNEVRLRLDQAHDVLIDISQRSYAFTQKILERGLSEKERERLLEQVKQREELGKKLLQREG